MEATFSKETLKNFIAFEGLDGAGSSTHAELLVKALRRAGRPALLTTEPTSGPIGNLVRLILRGRLGATATRERTDQQLAHLFAADRFDHLYNAADGIVHLIDRGFTVVSTRYHFSSYAYNARTEKEFDLVDRLNRDFPLPELVVFLRVPLEVSMERIQKRDMHELYEKEEELKRVAANYQRLFAPIRDRVLEFTPEGDVEEMNQQIFREVAERLGIQPGG